MRPLTSLLLCLLMLPVLAQEGPLPAPADLPAPRPAPPLADPSYTPPLTTAAPPAGAPAIYEYTHRVAPDQTCFIVGEGFSEKTTAAIWGPDRRNAGGALLDCPVRLLGPSYLTVTIPEAVPAGVYLLWLRNEQGWSLPVRLNAPEVFLVPRSVAGERELRLLGQGLASVSRALVLRPSGPLWLENTTQSEHEARFSTEAGLAPGRYQVWLHAGSGGAFGWGTPVTLTVPAPPKNRPTEYVPAPQPGRPSPDLQKVLDLVGSRGGGTVSLATGRYDIRGTLKVPANTELTGAFPVTLTWRHSPPESFRQPQAAAWGQGVAGIHSVGDEMEYRLDVPAGGKWTVWLRYGTDMSPWGQAGVSGNHSLRVGAGQPVPLDNLPNTGSFGLLKWARTATLELTRGSHQLTWRNDRGGGINPDAFVFALDPQWQPTEGAFPVSSDRLIVLQAEAVTRFDSKDGSLPGGEAPAVWLAGDGAAVTQLDLVGSPQVSTGVLVASDKPQGRLRGATVANCRLSGLGGRPGQGIRLVRADEAVVWDNQVEAKWPLLLQGVRRCDFVSNLLTPVRGYGDPALAAIVGSQDTVEECTIEGNEVSSPPGSEAGGPEVMRLIWLSTGHGSVSRNYIAGNGLRLREVEQEGDAPDRFTRPTPRAPMRFGGVGGREQNVGEVILFEGNHRTMFFGRPAAADATSVTLPKTVPTTPDELLGSVKREELAHDAAGNETPFWPPDSDDGSAEPPLSEYYVSVFSGPGQGQSRRVLSRKGETLQLEYPWRVPPTSASRIVIGTAFYRNLIVNNRIPDGMTGIQLWISCLENVVSANTIERMRRPGFYLYSNATTLASSMPRTWNRGLSPLFFNLIEGNRTDECSAGALVTSGEDPKLPVEFPRALGNTLRHNSFVRSRTEGVTITAGRAKAGDTCAAIAGTVVEFNTVRDAPVSYRSAEQSDAAVFRRNQAYFWYPMSNSADPYVAFEVDRPGAQVVVQDNTVEGKVGELRPQDVIEQKRAQ